MKRLAAPLVLFLALGGCAGGRHQTTASIPAARIAVLPVQSDVKDPAGPVLVRNLVQRWLAERGYVAVPLAVVDQVLEELKVTDPRRMDNNTRLELQKRTGAEALAIANLLDFAQIHRGFSQERRVSLHLRLIDPATGDILWQKTDEEVTAQKTINPTQAILDYVRGLGTQALEEALKSPLLPETSRLIARMLRSLPTYRPA